LIANFPKTKLFPSWSTSPNAVASARLAAWSRSTRTPSYVTASSPGVTPANSTTNSSLFPPQTREAQFDEKWAFVAKKEKHCDPDAPDDARCGENWDHVAFDPEHRLVVSVVPGKRTAERVGELIQDFQRRTGGRLMNLLTSDDYSAYEGAILEAYGVIQEFPRTGRPGRPKQPITVPPPELNYATVHKTREKGRVVKVEPRVIFGTVTAVLAALAVSLVSKVVNTFFIERHNGTDRHRNSRKVRTSYGFSKDWEVQEAMTYFTMYSYNFCWPVRTLRWKGSDGQWQPRTPAMAAGLTDHVWSLQEWATLPAVQH
jgi:IS1 family transposase